MPVAALLLLLASGVAHAVWNLFVKKAADPSLHFAGAMTCALVLYAPIFFLAVAPLPPTPWFAWAAAAATGLTEGVYLILLTYSYRDCDLSVVYPISRGSAPLFILVAGVALLGERVSPIGYGAVALVVVGVLAVAWPNRGARAQVTRRAVALSVATGIAIATHHIGYKWLFRYWSPPAAIFVVWLVTAATLGVYAVARTSVRAAARYFLRALPAEALTGVLAMAGFLAALWALNMTLVSYVGAARNLGIIFGAFFGARLLGEGAFGQRLGGALAITAGVVLMAFA